MVGWILFLILYFAIGGLLCFGTIQFSQGERFWPRVAFATFNLLVWPMWIVIVLVLAIGTHLGWIDE